MAETTKLAPWDDGHAHRWTYFGGKARRLNEFYEPEPSRVTKGPLHRG